MMLILYSDYCIASLPGPRFIQLRVVEKSGGPGDEANLCIHGGGNIHIEVAV